jgi:hypothetical protein
MTNLQFLYLSNVTNDGIPEIAGLLGASTVATGLAVSQIVPLTFVLMIMVDRAGIFVSLTAYRHLLACEQK